MKQILMRIGLLTTTIVLITGTVYLHRPSAVRPPPPTAAGFNAQTGGDSAHEFHRTLSIQEKQHILDGKFVIITSTESLPQPVKNAFATITEEKPFSLANPGTKYQVTDVVEEPGLANRRLIFAGVSKNRWFIHYEHGGVGVGDIVMVLDSAPDNSIRFVWAGAGFKKASNLDDLRTAIASGRFADDLPYCW